MNKMAIFATPMNANRLSSVITLIVFASMLLFSCSKESMGYSEESEIIAIWNEQDALRDFSIALSKVVSTNEDARALIKNESLRKFDNDYDVLFANIKDRNISEGKTLGDIVQAVLGEKASIDDILSIVPTLTIYVTDVTWLDPDGFRADRWDTSDRRVSVTYLGAGKECEKLYANGSFIGRIEPYTIPGGPVLIVKKNERVRAKANTRAGVDDNPYEFIADAFNPACNKSETKGNNYYTGPYSWNWVEGQTPGEHAETMLISMLNSINPDIIAAYEMFKDNEYALQNDYICYGMTPDSLQGRLKPNVHLRLVRFKIHPSAFESVVDEYGIDKHFSGKSWSTDDNGQGASAEPSVSTIYSKIWSDGRLEIHSDTYGLSGATQYLLNEDVYNVGITDLFTINQQSIKRERWGSTPIKWYITWRYSITDRDATTLTEKWYYPANTADLPTWDLVNNSAFYMRFTEHDSGATTNTQVMVTNKKANSFSFSGEGSVGVLIDSLPGTIKLGLGWSGSFEDSYSNTVTRSVSENDELLLGQLVQYTDNYITSRTGMVRYGVHSYNGGSFEFTVLPYKL